MKAPASPPAAAPASAQPPGDTTPAGSEERLLYLFRHSQRAGRVHVLQHLLRRYRAGERA
jgi:hypothetical protein